MKNEKLKANLEFLKTLKDRYAEGSKVFEESQRKTSVLTGFLTIFVIFSLSAPSFKLAFLIIPFLLGAWIIYPKKWGFAPCLSQIYDDEKEELKTKFQNLEKLTEKQIRDFKFTISQNNDRTRKIIRAQKVFYFLILIAILQTALAGIFPAFFVA